MAPMSGNPASSCSASSLSRKSSITTWGNGRAETNVSCSSVPRPSHGLTAEAGALLIIGPPSSGDSLEVALRIEGDEEPLHVGVPAEPSVLAQELVHGLHGPRAEAREDGMSVQVGVLDDEVAARRDERGVGVKLVQHVVPGVVGVED